MTRYVRSCGPVGALLAGLLLFAPLFYGANRPIPLLLLQWGSLVLAGLLVLGAGRLHTYPPLLRLGLALLTLLPLLYLIPLPYALWVLLPGHAGYGAVLAEVGGAGGWRPASLLPPATELAWLSLGAPLVVLWAVLSLSAAQVQRLVVLVCLSAGLQAAWVLVQFGGPAPVNQMYSGSYANRNHLAGFLNLCLPVLLAALVASLGTGHERVPWRVRLLGVASPRGAVLVFSAALGLLLILGVVFSQSRAGIGLMLLGVALSFLVLVPRIGGLRASWGVGSVLIIALGCALAIGLTPILQRFAGQELIQDGRWILFRSTVQGIQAFFPLGSGPGTFPAVYPQFQPPDLALYINHAHNDYLEWLFEAGLPAAVLLLLFLGLYAQRGMHLLRRRHWAALHFIQAGAGIGLLLLLLHGLVDFNLRIPANTVYAAFWLGVFWHDGWPQRPWVPPTPEPPPVTVALDPIVPSPVRNPFLD